MFQIVEFLKKRPKDKTIRIARVIYWLILLALIWLNFNEISFSAAFNQYSIYLKYVLIFFSIVPIIMWITDVCFAKRKYVRIIQIIFWLLLIFSWNIIISKEPASSISQQDTVNLSQIQSTWNAAWIDVWFWIALLWLLPLLAWITWKCISQKCFKHWEVITKIRV